MEHNPNNDFDLALEIGELKGLMQGVIKRLDTQNGTVAALASKVSRHDIVFGKIGVIVAGIGIFFSAVSVLATEWVKTKFFK